jgi:flagellar FliL protein
LLIFIFIADIKGDLSMQKLKSILSPKILIPVITGLVLVGGVLYTLFAPATWWRPFYVRLEMDETPTPEAYSGVAPPEVGTSAPGPAPQSPQHATYIQSGQPTGVMYELESKVVNLAEPGGLRYLQVSIVLEVWPLTEDFFRLEGEERDLAADEFRENINTWRPVIDDLVTTILSSKTFDQIATVEGKQTLKDELISAINEALGYQGVINVYFTNFVVQ